jgi:hypothetical protein
MPQGEVSFARLGDDRWTWVAPGDDTGLPSRYGYRDAMYSATDDQLRCPIYDLSFTHSSHLLLLALHRRCMDGGDIRRKEIRHLVFSLERKETENIY